MILFLQDDTGKEHPIGYEKSRRNIFNPADDDKGQQEPNGTGVAGTASANGQEPEGIASMGRRARRQSFATTSESATNQTCARLGCTKQPRFDSVFCSDSCGVSELERDLLHSLLYAGDIHPALLRAYA